MKIAPGIHRIGDQSIVNSYLLEDAGEVTIIDAGVPGHYRDMPRELALMGRTVDDVRALLLTHGHSDHIGFAERLRRQQQVPVSVHEADAALARGEVPNPAKGFGPTRLGPLIGFLWYTILRGGLRTPKLQQVATFGDGASLDVPGSPRVILTPATRPGAPCSTSPPAMYCSWAMRWRPTRSQPVPAARRWRPLPPMPPRRWRPWPVSKTSPPSSCSPGMAIRGPAASRRRFGRYAKVPHPGPDSQGSPSQVVPSARLGGRCLGWRLDHDRLAGNAGSRNLPAIRQQPSLASPHAAPCRFDCICVLSNTDVGRRMSTYWDGTPWLLNGMQAVRRQH